MALEFQEGFDTYTLGAAGVSEFYARPDIEAGTVVGEITNVQGNPSQSLFIARNTGRRILAWRYLVDTPGQVIEFSYDYYHSVNVSAADRVTDFLISTPESVTAFSVKPAPQGVIGLYREIGTPVLVSATGVLAEGAWSTISVRLELLPGSLISALIKVNGVTVINGTGTGTGSNLNAIGMRTKNSSFANNADEFFDNIKVGVEEVVLGRPKHKAVWFYY